VHRVDFETAWKEFQAVARAVGTPDARFALEDADDADDNVRPVIVGGGRRTWLASLTVLFVVGVTTLGWWMDRRSAAIDAPVASAARVALAPLTTDPGYDGEPTFAPDGGTSSMARPPGRQTAATSSITRAVSSCVWNWPQANRCR
jgi:hypothetical protein